MSISFIDWCCKNGKEHIVAKDLARRLRKKRAREREYKKWKRALRREHYSLIKHFKTNDNRTYYRNVYLKTEHWQKLKERKLNENPFCQICGTSDGILDVHHLKYRNLYDVKTKDLATLCRKCHEEWHSRLRELGMKLR